MTQIDNYHRRLSSSSDGLFSPWLASVNGRANAGREKCVTGMQGRYTAYVLRQPIVRDIFPLHASHPLKPGQTVSGLLNKSPSRLHGALAIADRGAPNHHRWERLCLIELAGLAALQSHRRGEADQSKQKCPDCGKVHVEMFLVDKGTYEHNILDFVLRWQRFVEL